MKYSVKDKRPLLQEKRLSRDFNFHHLRQTIVARGISNMLRKLLKQFEMENRYDISHGTQSINEFFVSPAVF